EGGSGWEGGGVGGGGARRCGGWSQRSRVSAPPGLRGARRRVMVTVELSGSVLRALAKDLHAVSSDQRAHGARRGDVVHLDVCVVDQYAHVGARGGKQRWQRQVAFAVGGATPGTARQGGCRIDAP